MSLESLRAMRRSGNKPANLIWVVIGEHPRQVHDSESLVVVRPNVDPKFMDWRPLVGLWVALFSQGQSSELILKTLDALQAVNAKVFGAVDESGVYPCIADPKPEHNAMLHRAWELSCT
jgi:hypothetical protein